MGGMSIEDDGAAAIDYPGLLTNGMVVIGQNYSRSLAVAFWETSMDGYCHRLRNAWTFMLCNLRSSASATKLPSFVPFIRYLSINLHPDPI